MDKLIKHAQYLYEGYEYKEIKHDNETENRLVLKDEVKAERWHKLSDLMFKVSEQTKLSQDSTYQFTYEALSMIADATVNNEDELRELGYSIEADVYTSDLTNWLNENNDHVNYLDEAISNGATTGIDLLAIAQSEAKREVFEIVLEHLLSWTTVQKNIATA